MKLLDSRRLTGPNLMAPVPLAIAEVLFDEGEDPAAALAAWEGAIAELRPSLATLVRRFRGGAALGLPVPIDELLPTTDMNEWAIERATAVAAGRAPAPLEPRRAELLALRAAALRPSLLALEAEAARRGLPFLWDDTEVTIGAGRRARTFALAPPALLPPVEAVAWGELASVPTALITGTNGKTTCARLLARIVRRAGRVPGLASTEELSVDEQRLASGDWTGPAAARTILRHPTVEVAVLETARGGILRRGLALTACDAALITNVSADHLGDYGIDDVATMARVKSVVARAVRPGGKLVLPADDTTLVSLAPTFSSELIYFSPDEHHPVLASHRQNNGETWFVRSLPPSPSPPPPPSPSPSPSPSASGTPLPLVPTLCRTRATLTTPLLPLAEIPITFAGAATYNVRNALAAAALAAALGLPDDAIADGLRSFHPTPEDNPGRSNLVEVRGVRVLLDFGHNPEGIAAVMQLVRALRAPGARLSVILAQPGDRSDEALAAVARSVAQGAPDHVHLYDLVSHLRGRLPGVVPALLHRSLLAHALPAAALHESETELTALDTALDASRPGDLVVILPHLDRDGVKSLLARRGAI